MKKHSSCRVGKKQKSFKKKAMIWWTNGRFESAPSRAGNGGESKGFVQSGQRLDVRGKPIGRREVRGS